VGAIASFFSCDNLLKKHRRVLSPHITFIVKEKSDTGLLAAVGRRRDLEPHEIGTLEHAGQVREVVSSMLEELG